MYHLNKNWIFKSYRLKHRNLIIKFLPVVFYCTILLILSVQQTAACGVTANVDDNTPCVGQTVSFTATYDQTRDAVWDFGDGAVPETGSGTPVSVYYTTSGQKTITVTAYGRITGAPYTDDLTITVNPLPSTPAGITAAPAAICSGSSSTISVTPPGTGYTTDWFTGSCGGTALPGGTGQNSVSVSPAVTTTYYARTLNTTTGCISACATVTVTVNALPSTPTGITAAPAAICSGSSSTISVNNPGTGYTTDWFTGSCGGTALPGGTGQNSVLVNPAATTTYYARTRNTTTGCISACATVTVTVNALPSTPTGITAAPAAICSGSSSTISVNNPGTGYTTDWFTVSCGGTPLEGGTGQNSVSVSPAATTTYYARTRNTSTGCVSSCSTVTVTVNPLPSSPAGITASPDVICSGSSSTISVTDPGTGFTTDWFTGSCGGTALEGGTGQNSVSVSPTATTTYYARTRNTATGCVSACETVTVTVSTSGIWTGSADGSTWEMGGNWCGGSVPTGAVVIPAGADVHVTASLTAPSSCSSLTVNGTLTINAGSALTVSGTLTNNGSLNMLSSSGGQASLRVDTYTGNDANIQLYLSPGYWHYISSPTNPGLSSDDLAAGNDLARFDEALPSVDPPTWQRGWVAWDGWSYLTGDYTGGYSGFSALERGRGYNYWNESAYTFTFSGQLNTSDPSPSISFSGDPVWSGYNLLGNPYSCGIDLQYLLSTLWQAAPIFKSVYYTINDVSYTVSQDGTSVPSGASLSIPPMQGFFVKATGGGNLSFSTSARIHTSTPRYKGEQTSSIPLVRLSINENGKTDETVVRFNEKATAGLDVEFDAPKFIGTPGNPSIYTSMNGTDFTINGIPFPETSVDIPVVLNLLAGGNLKINALELQDLDNYKVFLKDKVTASSVDLRSANEYSFSSEAGLVKDRFTLTVTNMTTGIEDPVKPADAFNIYSGFDFINIQPLSDEWDGLKGMVRIMDLSGKPVRYQDNTEFNKNSLVQIPAPEKGGLYFVEIRSGLMKFVGKVVVK